MLLQQGIKQSGSITDKSLLQCHRLEQMGSPCALRRLSREVRAVVGAWAGALGQGGANTSGVVREEFLHDSVMSLYAEMGRTRAPGVSMSWKAA